MAHPSISIASCPLRPSLPFTKFLSARRTAGNNAPIAETVRIANSVLELNGMPSNLRNPEPGTARNANQRIQYFLFPVITGSDLTGNMG